MKIRNLSAAIGFEDGNGGGGFAKQKPAMYGKYSVHNRLLRCLLIALDFLLYCFLFSKKVKTVAKPKRILVANWAHAGDVFLTVPTLCALKKMYPDAVIDVLIGTWGHAVLSPLGIVDNFYYVDHFLKLNRSSDSFLEKFRKYVFMRRRAVRAIAAAGYDVAIDCYGYFPPASPLFFAAKIPVRVGFSSGGFGPLLTNPVRFEDPRCGRHISKYPLDLIEAVFRDFALNDSDFCPVYPNKCVENQFNHKFGENYIVVHVGVGAKSREWPFSSWKSLIRKLVESGRNVVLTGSGVREEALIAEIRSEIPQVVQAVNLKWSQFVSVVKGARCLICPETSVAHVGSAFSVPTVVVYSGMTDPTLWGPYGDSSIVVRRNIACSPCRRTNGCSEMACIRGIPVQDVFDAFDELAGDDSSDQ